MAFSTNGIGGRHLSSEINVTPLIDVLLVLLIIFMAIVPMMPHGLGAMLPPSTIASVVASQPVMVEVEQSRDGVHYRLNGQGVGETELRSRLAELLSRQSARIVLLKGDGALSFKAVARVIDTGYADGARSVELITPEVARP